MPSSAKPHSKQWQPLLEQKKVINGHLFQRVEVGKGYNVNVVLDMTYQQFCEEWKEFSDLIAG